MLGLVVPLWQAVPAGHVAQSDWLAAPVVLRNDPAAQGMPAELAKGQ